MSTDIYTGTKKKNNNKKKKICSVDRYTNKILRKKSEENIQRYKPDPYEYTLNDM